GALLVMGLVFITCFPPVPGYGTFTMFAGFVYGIPLGFLVTLCSGLLGACSCFLLCRRFGRRFAQRLVGGSPHIAAVLRTVDKKGLRLLILIRLAPYPYNLMNALLSLTSLPLKVFATATAVSLLKTITHVAVGANLENLTDALMHNPSVGKLLLGLLTVLLGIGVTVYLYRLTARIVQEMEAETMEDGGHGHRDDAIAMESAPWQLGSADDGDEVDEDGESWNWK
ncbi:snare associated Golgi protein-domain-containing protein, partial [Thamnocephalis sphaerospora]